MSFVLVIVVGLWLAQAQAQQIAAKKLIYYGWGTRNTIYAREHWREMEAMPFDGIGITVAVDREAWREGRNDTSNQLGWNVFGPKALRLEDFRSAIADLKGARWQKFTDNFLPVATSSSGQDHGFDWFDEARWKTVLNNWRLLVTIAKEGGLKGIILDPEHYGAYFFSYPQMSKGAINSFTEYQEKVRQRGGSLMELTRRIFPDITIFCLYGYAVVWNEVRDTGNLKQVKPLESATYGLYPAFLDGMLEGASSAAVFVDGYESAYGFKNRHQFERAHDDIRNKAILLSSVPQRYASQVQAGFGLWLDNGGVKQMEYHGFQAQPFLPSGV